MSTRYRPDAVVCFRGPSTIVASIVIELAHYVAPLYVVGIAKATDESAFSGVPGYKYMETTKWHLYIPESLFAVPSRRLLLIDDCVISGDSLHALRTILIQSGYQKENIQTASIICTNVAKETKKSPDHCYFFLENTTFHLPWGKGY